jgi:hypothetical protein
MTDATPPVPPLPERSAQDAARTAETPAAPAAAAYDPDDTGVPTSLGDDIAGVGRGFFRALFDISFRTFITRRLASAFYVVGLVGIGIGFLVYFLGGILRGSSLLFVNLGAGLSLIVATVILVPLLTFLSIVVLRFVIEAVVALIAIAENTERTAENTGDARV